MKVVALAGGVGGAKLVEGLAQALDPELLTVIVNTGDDFEHFGLKICPDLDTVCYTLAGISNPGTGWGRSDESWDVFEGLKVLGAPTWFRLGDRDLATHLERSRRLAAGESLSQVTRKFCQYWGIRINVLPMSDGALPTIVYTSDGPLPFQEYFVRLQCRPRVKGFGLPGLENGNPAPGVLDALLEAELVVICPSNPWVSIDPILALPGLRAALLHGSPVVAVSPIIAGQTVKGPAAKMFEELGVKPSALAVAHHYGSRSTGGFLSGFILDGQDAGLESSIGELRLKTRVTSTLMQSSQDRLSLAQDVLTLGEQLRW